MAHVELDASATPPRLLIDGVDIAMSVLANSVHIRSDGPEWTVQFTVAPEALRAKLPDAVLSALPAQDGGVR